MGHPRDIPSCAFITKHFNSTQLERIDHARLNKFPRQWQPKTKESLDVAATQWGRMSYLAAAGIGATATDSALSAHLSGRWGRDWKNAFPLHVKTGEKLAKKKMLRKKHGKPRSEEENERHVSQSATEQQPQD